jgi:RecQ-mediated genome instability protein 1
MSIMRSPLREISPPPSPPLFPQRNDDEDLEPRRRKVPKNNSSSSSIATSRPIAGFPSLNSLGGVSTARSATLVGSNSISPHFPFSGPQINVLSVENARSAKGRGMGLNLQPTIRQTAPNLPSPPTQEPDEASFDFELLDALDENQPHSTPIVNSNKGKGRAADATTTKTGAELSEEFPSSDDYGIDNMNDDFWRELDEAEASADRSAPATTFSSSSGLGSSWSAVGRKTGGVATRDTPALSAPLEVITIDSDDDLTSAEDKENVPVPTRHVRRRTEDGWEGLGGGGLTQRREGRPVVLATNPDDILVLTDSE